MRRLIYTSQSQVGSNWAELDSIVSQSSVSNQMVGITGMLWADEYRFVQVLEGDRDVVGDTIERIGADARHVDIEIVCDRPVIHKLFGGWAMVRTDHGPDGTANTAFLVGLVASERGSAARKAYNLLLK